MFMSSDFDIVWERLQDPRSQTPFEIPNILHSYVKNLHEISNQAHIARSHTRWSNREFF
jgi:hypothetical protein